MQEKPNHDELERRVRELEESLRITQFSFENANVGIYRIASDGQIMEVNQEAAKLLGYTREELKRLSIMDVDTAVTRESWARACKILSDEGSYAHERTHRRKDGCTMPVETFAKYLDYDGQQYVIAFVQDISERKRMEQALKKNMRLLHNIVESMSEGLFVLNSDYTCTRFNSSLEKMTHTTREAAVGKAPWETFPPLKDTLVAQNIKKAMGGESVEDVETQVTLPNGDRAWFRDSFSPLKDDDGNVSGVVAVVSDISKRKQAENEREKLLKELQEALENVKTLSGLLPICSSCKKIRDDKGYWNQIELYISIHSEVDFSHGICPDCAKRLYPYYTPREE
jgi:PAS domain S-box-containing protein